MTAVASPHDPGGSAVCVAGVVYTGREMQWLHGVTRGLSDREIGAELYLSEDTVKHHGGRTRRKLGARDRAHAVATAMRLGLLPGASRVRVDGSGCPDRHVRSGDVVLGPGDALRLAQAWSGTENPLPAQVERAGVALAQLANEASW